MYNLARLNVQPEKNRFRNPLQSIDGNTGASGSPRPCSHTYRVNILIRTKLKGRNCIRRRLVRENTLDTTVGMVNYHRVINP